MLRQGPPVRACLLDEVLTELHSRCRLDRRHESTSSLLISPSGLCYLSFIKCKGKREASRESAEVRLSDDRGAAGAFRRVVDDDTADVEHRALVGDLERLVHRLLHEQHREPLAAQTANRLEDVLHDRGSKAG